MKAMAAKQQPSNDFHRQHQEVVQAPLIQNEFPSTDAIVVQRMSACPCDGGCPLCEGDMVIQPKLRIGEPGDRYEREADRVAEQVMRMPEPGVQRQVELEEEEKLQTKKAPGQTPEDTPDLESHIQALKGGGQSMPESVHAFFELRFGCDFNRVRVHTDARAAEIVRAVNAQAFTIGRDVVFGAGQYAPETISGKKLLAHELTHVVQQNGGPTLFSNGKNSENTILNSQELSIVSPELSEVPTLQAYYPRAEQHQPTSTDIYYSLSASTITLREILNAQRRHTNEYQMALQNWPADQQIWPHLRSRGARIEFIHYLLEFDRTNCRPYSPTFNLRGRGCQNFARNQETFPDRCLGYATQLHIRFRDQPARPDPDQIERLRSQAHIYFQAIEPKYRIPIVVVTAYSLRSAQFHAFNAILVDRDPSNIESYLFVEPQTDTLFEPSSNQFNRVFLASRPIPFSEWREINEHGENILTTRHTFIRIFSGRTIEADLTEAESDSMRSLHGTIFIVDYGGNDWQERVGDPNNYDNYVRRVTGREISDDDLVRVAPYFIGLYFRRSPGAAEELLDIDTLLRLVNRESLRQRLEQSFLDLLQLQQEDFSEPPPSVPITPPGLELV